MSNLLQKLFIETVNTVPAGTVTRWVPERKVGTLRAFGYLSHGLVNQLSGGAPITPEYAIKADRIVNPLTGYCYVGIFIGPLITVDNNGNKTLQWFDVAVSGYELTVNVVPGHYETVAEPAKTTTTYDPNIGWNAGARSLQSALGDCTASFSVPQSVIGVIVGLTNITDIFAGEYRHVRYSLVFNSGQLRVVDNALLFGAGTYTDTDVFTISRNGEDIFYAKNGNVFYKATTPNSDELTLDAILYAGGDSVVNSSIDGITAIEQRSAALVNTAATLAGTPKPQAKLTNDSSALVQDGLWFDGTDYHAGPQALTATSNLIVVKEFGAAALTTTSVLTGTGHHVTEIHGVFGQMSAFATEGYYAYAEISTSMSAMTCQAGADQLAFDMTYVAAAFPQMEGTITSLVGQTNLDVTMTLPSMTGLLADRAYAEINVGLQSMFSYGGNWPSLGNYVFTEGPTFSCSSFGYATDSNFANLNLFDITGTALGGATSANSLFDLSLSSTGTMLDTGSAALLPMFTCTLSATGRKEERGEASLLPFFSSTITAFGGGAAALTGPTFTFASTGTGNPTGKAELPFLSFTLSSTGTKNETGTAALLPMFTMALSYSTCSGAAPLFTLSSAGSDAVSNAVAYVMNVHTQESTKYSNFGFMHIINIGNKPYGVKADGLYLLEGTTDNGVAINGSATTKETDFGSFQSKNVPTAYLNSDTLTTITPIVDAVTHPAYSSTFGGRKTLIARGITGRYWKFKIDGIQQVEGVEFLPETRQRRVK